MVLDTIYNKCKLSLRVSLITDAESVTVVSAQRKVQLVVCFIARSYVFKVVS